MFVNMFPSGCAHIPFPVLSGGYCSAFLFSRASGAGGGGLWHRGDRLCAQEHGRREGC